MPSRRAVLAACSGGLAGLAGCSFRGGQGTPGGPTPTESPPSTDTPTPSTPVPVGTARPVGDATVTVTAATAQSSVVHLSTPDSMDVTVADDRFVLVGVSATAPAPEEAAFTLVAGDRTVAPTDVGYGSLQVGGDRRLPYRGGADEPVEGWLAFEVPAPLSAGAIRLTCRGASWLLPDAVLADLARPTPTWALRSVAVPDELTPGEEFTVRVRAANTSDVDARFRGALNVEGLRYAYYPYPFSVPVPAGESGTWARELTVPDDHETGRGPGFHLRTPAGDRDVTADVVPDSARGTSADG